MYSPEEKTIRYHEALARLDESIRQLTLTPETLPDFLVLRPDEKIVYHMDNGTFWGDYLTLSADRSVFAIVKRLDSLFFMNPDQGEIEFSWGDTRLVCRSDGLVILDPQDYPDDSATQVQKDQAGQINLEACQLFNPAERVERRMILQQTSAAISRLFTIAMMHPIIQAIPLEDLLSDVGSLADVTRNMMLSLTEESV